MASENNIDDKIPHMISCMILCAGTSKRFGSNKMLAALAGRPLLAHTIDRIEPQVSDLALNGAGGAYDGFGLAVIPDSIKGQLGPLAGILTAMEWAAGLGYDRVLTVSGDTPFVPKNFAYQLSTCPEQKIGLAQVGQNTHNVCGLWPVRLAPELGEFLRDGKSFKVQDFLALYETCAVSFEKTNGIDPFFNVNTREDMAIAEKMLAQKARP